MKKPEYYKKALNLGLVLSALALSAVNSHAATRTWDGGGDGTGTDFNTADNWNANFVPVAADTATMEGGGDGATVLSGGIANTIRSLNVRNGHLFTINNDGETFTVDLNVNMGRAAASSNNSAINHSAGAVDFGGLDMGGNATGGTSSYTLSGTASLSIVGGSGRDLDIGGDVGVGDFATTFAINGDAATVTVNAAPVVLRSSAILDYKIGATGIDAIDTTGNFTLQSGATLTVDGSSYTGGAGTITLFTYGTRTDATEFTTETITNFAGLAADVVYDEDSIDLVLTSIVNPGDLAILLFYPDDTEINPGGSTTLNWTVQNETTLTLDQGIGSVFGTTSIIVSPSTTTTYTLTAGDGVGTVMDTVTVTVLPQINSFTASDTVVGSGDTVTLNWSVTNATGLTLNPGGIPVTGTTTDVNPTTDTTYELVATNGGSTSVSATVDVQVGPIIDSFTTDLHYVVSGGAVTIDWTTQNLGSSPSLTLTADNMIAPPADTDVLNVTPPLVLNPTENTTYTLTASDGVNADVTESFDVVIIPDYPVIPSGGRIISVNFHVDADADAQADHELTAGETAGFVPLDGSVWNNINVGPGAANASGPIFAPTALMDDLGNPSVATLAPSVDSTWFVGYAASAAAEAEELVLPGADDNLFNSYLALNGPNGDGNPADAAVLSISGLGSDYTTGGYTLIVYSDSDRRSTSSNTRRSEFTLTPAGGSPVTAFVEDDDLAPGINVFDNTYVFSDEVEDGADYANFTIFTGLTAASFDLEITSPDGGRGAISGFQIIGNTGLPTAPLQMTISQNGANLEFDWNGIPGMTYNLRGSTSLDTAPATWPIVQGDIPSTEPMPLTIARPADPKYFYVLEEFPTPAP